MPLYNYMCLDCKEALAKDFEIDVDELTDDDLTLTMFETRHNFDPPEDVLRDATQCPLCEGHNTEKTVMGVPAPYFRIRGHDWREFRKNNAAALSRDMALHQLQSTDPDTGKSEDPYGQYRAEGEAKDLAYRIKKDRNKPDKSKHFDMSPKTPPEPS